jgi:hypothetical protein
VICPDCAFEAAVAVCTFCRRAHLGITDPSYVVHPAVRSDGRIEHLLESPDGHHWYRACFAKAIWNLETK